ncbi:alpha/beta hydrolase [Candidatus Falkowbacteria bacterium]|nr:alpha/beta hydrolase [Candidatus Falkowbacteria bacterium]
MQNPTQKQSLIFISGFGGNQKIYQKSLNTIKNNFDIFAIDFTRPLKTKDLTIKSFADSIHQFIIKNKIKNPIIIGHSFGGAVSMAYGLYYENYQQIILLNPVGLIPLNFKKIIIGLLAGEKILLKSAGLKMVTVFVNNIFSHPVWSLKKIKIIKKLHFKENEASRIQNLKIIFSDKDAHFPLKEILKLPKNLNIKIIKGAHEWPILEPTKFKEIIQKTCQN